MHRRAIALTLCLLLAAPAGEAQAHPRGPSFELERRWTPGHDDWEPANAVSRNGRWVYQMTTRYGGPDACRRCPDPSMAFRASDDAGATWGPRRFVCACPGVGGQHDPQVEVATDGRVYVSFLNDFTPGVMFARSANHGRTWTSPVAVDGPLRWSDKPILAISPTGRHVYIAFNRSDSFIAASHDFGDTFARPVRTNRDGRYYFAGGGAVAPDGAVHFAEAAYHQNSRGTVKVLVMRSVDRGRSWIQTVVDVSSEQPRCSTPGCPRDFLGPQAALAIDRSGLILLAYNLHTKRHAPAKLFVRTSTDGVRWSPRTRVSTAPRSVHHAFPAVAAGPRAGTFHVGWQDDRAGAKPQRWWNTWYRRTDDGGLTWGREVDLSKRARGARYKSPLGYAFPYGDYWELAVDRSGRVHTVWGEGPSYPGPGGTWFTRQVPAARTAGDGRAGGDETRPSR